MEMACQEAYRQLCSINNSHVKTAKHWQKLKGFFQQQQNYIKQLGKRADGDQQQLENEAATIIQAWWRSLSSRRRATTTPMSSEERRKKLQQSGSTHQEGPNRDDDDVEEEEVSPSQNIEEDVLLMSQSDEENKAPSRKVDEKIYWDELELEMEELTRLSLDRAQEEYEKHKHEAASKIQAWWRGISYRSSAMLHEHKEKLRVCVQELRDAPSSESNPKEERGEPLNQRIERYMGGLLSTVLTERKATALRLNRLADRSHVAKECMPAKDVFRSMLECLGELNRSEAHLYVIRPLCTLAVKLLSHKPFIEPFALAHLDSLVSCAIHLIHNNYKDPGVVADQAQVLKQLSTYPGFVEKLRALHFDWYMDKFKQLIGRKSALSAKHDAYPVAYRQLCALQKLAKGGKESAAASVSSSTAPSEADNGIVGTAVAHQADIEEEAEAAGDEAVLE